MAAARRNRRHAAALAGAVLVLGSGLVRAAGEPAAASSLAPAAATDQARAWLDDRPAPDTKDWSEKRITEYAAQRRSAAAHALPEGLLRIPAVGLEVPVFDGTEERHLTLGAGRIEGTPPLASGGNTGLAAHRDGYFRAMKDVTLGDSIFVETPDGSFEYQIVKLFIVTPDAVEILRPTGADSITIVTCYPFYYQGNAPERYIIRAEKL